MKVLIVAVICLFIIHITNAGFGSLVNRGLGKYNNTANPYIGKKENHQCGYEVSIRFFCFLNNFRIESKVFDVSE